MKRTGCRTLGMRMLMALAVVTAGGLGSARAAIPVSAAGAHADNGVAVCAAPTRPHQVQCFARRPSAAALHPAVAGGGPTGYGPAEIQAAYALRSRSLGSGQTVAIVDAYDNPYAEADLAQYRAHYGLPPCTTANGCFRKVDQWGTAQLPAASHADWATEISTDLDAVSATCPNCHLLLVEAVAADDVDVLQSVDTAVALGATEVSLSLGTSEYAGEGYGDAHLSHPGVPIVVASGDNGYGGVQFPAASPHVVAVGGTTLVRDGSPRGWSETPWAGAMGGCSSFEPRPWWQATWQTHCLRRGVADVSAVSDPATGIAVYNSFEGAGWLPYAMGGTSVAAPIIAGTYALQGGLAGGDVASGEYAAMKVNDVTVNTSWSPCGGPDAWCNAVAGWDGPTGMGTPDGRPRVAATPLAATQGSTAFTVGWTPDWGLPAVPTYRVWSEDGSQPYTSWITTRAGSATFHGVPGHSYSFWVELTIPGYDSGGPDWLPMATTTVSPTATPATPFAALEGGDVYGNVLPGSSAPMASPTWGWPIARGFALRDASGGYTLDGWGGVHPAGTAPAVGITAYWPGWDIARGLAVCAAGDRGYVVDGFGGVHPFGGAPAASVTGYWPGWDIVRAVAVNRACTGGYTLDGWGGVHPFGTAAPVQVTGYWPGWNIARALVLDADGLGGYTLDGWGNIHAFGAATPAPATVSWPGWDIARAVVLLPGTGVQGYTLDGWGGMHAFGGAPQVVDQPGVTPGRDVARSLSLAALAS